jgi:hypothetical protein
MLKIPVKQNFHLTANKKMQSAQSKFWTCLPAGKVYD